MKRMQNGSAPGRSKRRMLLALSLTLVVLLIAVGGTVAWLIDSTSTLTNTFTPSKVDIDLTETGASEGGKSFKMVPGAVIGKDPKVTVKKDSEECWLFVKVVKSVNFDSFMAYTMASGWSQLMDGATPVVGVFYRSVGATTADVDFPVLNGNQVTVSSNVTETMMNGLGSANYPTLAFEAYAIQKAGFSTAAAAWTQITTPAP